MKHAQTGARHDREKAIKRRLRARERVILPAGREWLAVEAYPLSGARCADALKAVGLPVFEAREKARDQREGRAPRVAMVQVMRRVLFVGLRGWSDMRLIEECRYVWRVFSVTAHGLDWVPREHYRQALFEAEILGDRSMPFISGAAMQDFADHVIGYKRYDRSTGLSHVATEADLLALLFGPGDRVTVTGGPFASFRASWRGTIRRPTSTRWASACSAGSRACPVRRGSLRRPERRRAYALAEWRGI